jgi:hypothetical protein
MRKYKIWQKQYRDYLPRTFTTKINKKWMIQGKVWTLKFLRSWGTGRDFLTNKNSKKLDYNMKTNSIKIEIKN